MPSPPFDLQEKLVFHGRKAMCNARTILGAAHCKGGQELQSAILPETRTI